MLVSGWVVIRKADAMTFDRNDRAGFAPHRCERRLGRRSTVLAQLVTSAALALSITVAATAVTIGIARADGLIAIAEDSSANVAFGVVLAMVVIAAGLAVAVRRRIVSTKVDE
jgi:F0F1-type ATP synthase membrane subunit c/vacuolar-type H+-ATPase subunit K